MCSFDVDSLFTDIPPEEISNICTNLLLDNEDILEGTKKFEFKNLLSLVTQKLYFIFNGVPYKQKEEWPWLCLLDPLWQIFSCHFMKSNCLNSAFHNFFNTCHTNVSFSYEQENVEVFRVKEKFVTTVYRAPTFGGVYTHFEVS